jgi:hypothetical protein
MAPYKVNGKVNPHYDNENTPDLLPRSFPVKFRFMPLFTPETAAMAGRKGALTRWSRPPAPPELPPVTENGAGRIARDTLEEIIRVSQDIASEQEKGRPDVARLEVLSRVKLNLWRVYSHAGGVPIAAPLKARSRRDAGSIDLVPTIEILPEPGEPNVMAPYSVNDKASTSHDISPAVSSSETVQTPAVELPASLDLSAAIAKLAASDQDDPDSQY